MQTYQKKRVFHAYLLSALFAAVWLLFGTPEAASAAGKDIAACNVTLSQTSFFYSGSACTPEVTVTDGETVLKEGVDYALYGNMATTVGTHEITIAGIGSYTGQTTALFEIVKAKNEIILRAFDTFYTYSGPEEEEIYCSVKDNAKLHYSTNTNGASITDDGTLSVQDGFLGTVVVLVTSEETASYQAASASFSIEFKLRGTTISRILNKGIIDMPPENDHTVTVEWSAGLLSIQSVGGFQIRYSKDPNFQSDVYKAKIPMFVAMGSIVDSCTIDDHMAKGDRMYFQIRTYKKALDGKMYYSDWSETVAHDIDSSLKTYYREKYKGKSPKNGKVYTPDDGGSIRYQYKNGELAVYKKQKIYSVPFRATIPDKVWIYGKQYPVTTIQKGAFKNECIDKIVIGKNVKKIGADAFSGVSGLEKITIKSKKLKAKSIGKNAFKISNYYYLKYMDGTHYEGYEPVKVVAPKSLRAKYIKLLKKGGLLHGIK